MNKNVWSHWGYKDANEGDSRIILYLQLKPVGNSETLTEMFGLILMRIANWIKLLYSFFEWWNDHFYENSLIGFELNNPCTYYRLFGKEINPSHAFLSPKISQIECLNVPQW